MPDFDDYWRDGLGRSRRQPSQADCPCQRTPSHCRQDHLLVSPSTQRVADVVIRQTDRLREEGGQGCGGSELMGLSSGGFWSSCSFCVGVHWLSFLWTWLMGYWLILLLIFCICFGWFILLAINLLAVQLYNYPNVPLCFGLCHNLFKTRTHCSLPSCPIVM